MFVLFKNHIINACLLLPRICNKNPSIPINAWSHRIWSYLYLAYRSLMFIYIIFRISASLTHKAHRPSISNINQLTISRWIIPVHPEDLVKSTNMLDEWKLGPMTVTARSKAWKSSAAWTLGSWVRIPLEAYRSVCLYPPFLLFCV
jgi:hypothetical protein